MTRARKDKPTAPPLSEQVRAALASDWRTLAALDTLTAARGSDARRLVHEALRALRGEGVVLEERVGKGGVEVRLVPVVDPGPIPGVRYGLSPEQIEEMGGPEGVESVFAQTGGEPMDIDTLQAMTDARLEALPAPAPPVGQAAPVEPPRERTAAEWIASHNHDAAPAPKEPGPSSRCAVCQSTYLWHQGRPEMPHPFTPKPRGRPRVAPVDPVKAALEAYADDPLHGAGPLPRAPVAPIPNAAPAILPRVRQRRTPGPVVDVDGGRVERATPSKQAAILDGMRAQWDAAVAEHRAEREGEPETSRGGSEETPSGAAQGFADTLRKAFPDAFKPEIIDGSDVATVAREMVDLTIAFSPVVARRDSIDAVGVTPLDNGRFRVDALWETTGLPMEVDAAGLAVMRARYLLLRGLLTRSLSAMDFDTHRAVVRRFFQGVEPWAPAPGSPFARMGAGPITITVPDGVGIEAIDWTALMGALAGDGGEVPDVVPVRPLGPPPPPAPPPEPPAAHVLEGEHSRACGYWKVHDPAHCDPAKLAAEIKICRACWGKMYALGGGRPRVEDGRKYVGRYV